MKHCKFIFALILGLFLIASTSSCSGPSFKYNVEVTYQYENDSTVNYIVSFTDSYSYNSMVKDIDISYSVPAGYVNKLEVVPTITIYPDKSVYSREPIQIMFVPDRRFRVVDVKVNGGKVNK